MAECFAFDEFVLDVGDRQLRKGGQTLELNGRYFDALALLVRNRGRLVTKDQFLTEVWRGVPVTDEALTQCVRMLRRQLGDEAARPRFIETVPKHGYRFVAPLRSEADRRAEAAVAVQINRQSRTALLVGCAGTAGGGLAGLIGGLLYGFLASQPLEPAIGGASVLLVLLCVTTLVALIGAAGVSFGIAISGAAYRIGLSSVVGGALGGMVVGGTVKLLGLDAFSLLIGQTPGNITGAPEGLALGAATGAGAWLAGRSESVRRGAASAALCGGVAGLLIALAGGRLMLGSLDLLAHQLPGSRLRLDQISRLFGEPSLGPYTRTVTSALEGALFAAGVVGALMTALRKSLMR